MEPAVKKRLSLIDRSLYPDVSVVCGPPKRSEKDFRALTNPILLDERLVSWNRGTLIYHEQAIFSTIIPSAVAQGYH